MKRRRHGATLGIRRVLSSQLDPLSHYTTYLSLNHPDALFIPGILGGVAQLVELQYSWEGWQLAVAEINWLAPSEDPRKQINLV